MLQHTCIMPNNPHIVISELYGSRQGDACRRHLQLCLNVIMCHGQLELPRPLSLFSRSGLRPLPTMCVCVEKLYKNCSLITPEHVNLNVVARGAAAKVPRLAATAALCMRACLERESICSRMTPARLLLPLSDKCRCRSPSLSLSPIYASIGSAPRGHRRCIICVHVWPSLPCSFWLPGWLSMAFMPTDLG